MDFDIKTRAGWLSHGMDFVSKIFRWEFNSNVIKIIYACNNVFQNQFWAVQ